MAAKGKSRGQNWSERETQALVSIWSEDRIQRELKKSVRNDLAFAQISRELAERGYVRTVEQCRAKVKSLKAKYKQIADRLRRSGTGRESDEESEVPSDFPFFDDMDVVMGGRASVTPVHLLDSADAPDASTGSRTSTPVPVDSRTSTPVPLESRTSTPVLFAGMSEETSCLSPPQPETSGQPSIHEDPSGSTVSQSPPSTVSQSQPSTVSQSQPSAVSQPQPSAVSQSQPSAVSQSQPSGSHSEPSGTPISKKKRKRPNKLSKAEASARSLIYDIIEGQEKAKRRREEIEERRLKQEEKIAAEERERDRAFSTSMQEMMKMMTQYMAQQSAAFFSPFPMGLQQPGPSQPVPTYPSGYPPMPYAYGPPVTPVSASGPPPATTPATQDSSSEEED